MLYNPGNDLTPSSGVGIKGGVLTQVPSLENAATNLALQSADKTVAPWVTSGTIVVVPDSTTSPRGVPEADTLNDNGATQGEITQPIVILDDALARTFSEYLLAGTSTLVRIGVRLSGGTAKDAFIDVNPSTGAILSASPDVESAVVEATVINGQTWMRAAVAVANNASGNVTADIYIWPAAASAVAQGTVIAWGTQFELGSPITATLPAPTSQIATAAGQVTRVAAKIPSYLLDITQAVGPTLIAAGALTGAATQVISTTIPATYGALVLQINAASVSAGGRSVGVQLSVDAGASYDAVAANYQSYTVDGAAAVAVGAQASIMQQSAMPLAASTATGVVQLTNYQGNMMPQFTSDILDSAANRKSAHGWYTGSLLAINAMQFIVLGGAGVFDGAGTFSLYGIP